MGKERGTNIIFRSILLPVLSVVVYIAQCFPLKATLGYDCFVSAFCSGDQAQRAMGSSFKIMYGGLALHLQWYIFSEDKTKGRVWCAVHRDVLSSMTMS